MSLLLFWGLLGCMTVTALAFLLVPLWRRRTLPGISRRELNIALYRERLQEIEQAEAAGDSSAEETTAAKAELDARLIGDAGEPAHPHKAPASSFRRPAGLALALLLPALAIGIYWSNSDWRLALAGDGHEAVALLLQRLERHLEEEPADVQGWQLLAQSQMQLQNFDAAASAYARLNALAASADSLIGEAEARAMLAGGNLQGRSASLIEQALRLEPDSIRAQWYGGMLAWQRGDKTGALEYWNKVARQELPPDFRRMLESQIAQAGGKPPAAPQSLQIPVQVTLDPQLASRVTGEMPVFIYARAGGQGGPPLAVVRRSVAELPLTVVLDDSQSMLPERKLSSVDQWTITARVARQGSAESRSGDLVADTVVTRGQLPGPILLRIDRSVP
jgi:cytochrome c-type biogenesis protein CcmH